jgi:hypothetical protein
VKEVRKRTMAIWQDVLGSRRRKDVTWTLTSRVQHVRREVPLIGVQAGSSRRRIAKGLMAVCGIGRKGRDRDLIRVKLRQGRNIVKVVEARTQTLLLHPPEDPVVVLVDAATAARAGITVVLFVGEVVVVHVNVLALAVLAVAVAHAGLLRRYCSTTGQGARVEVEKLRWERRHGRHIRGKGNGSRLRGAIRAAQQADGSSEVSVVIAVVVIGAGNRGARRGGAVGHVAPLAEVAIPIVGKDSRLVGLAVGRAVGGVALDGAGAKVRVRVGAHGMVALELRGRGSFSGAQLLTQVRRARRRRRGAVAVFAVALLVHSDEDGGGLEQLHLLVLGDEQLRRVLPFRRVLPTRTKVNAELEEATIAVYVWMRVKKGHSS